MCGTEASSEGCNFGGGGSYTGQKMCPATFLGNLSRYSRCLTLPAVDKAMHSWRAASSYHDCFRRSVLVYIHNYIYRDY